MGDVMKACESCQGDGFVQVPVASVSPLTNIANARKVHYDGTLGVVFDYSKPAAFYQFKCGCCDGRGILEWKRGRSLTPIIPPSTEPT